MLKYDLVIAGAGYAGLVLAMKCLSGGMKVAVVDIKAEGDLGHDWSDSVEREVLEKRDIGFSEKEITAKPKGLHIISPLRSKEFFLDYAYEIVDMKLLHKRLLEKVEERGGELHLRARAYREVRRWNGKAKGNTEKVLAGWLSYHYGINGGYSWVHPETDDRIDVGAGIQLGKGYPDPENTVPERVKNLGLGERLRGGGGVIPVSSSHPVLYSHGVLLVGDSAFQAIPTSGCGAGNAMRAALIAGDALLRSRLNPDERGSLYERLYFQQKGADLAYYDVLRRRMQSFTPETLDWLMKKGILGSRELYASIHGLYQNTPAFSTLLKLAYGFTRIDVLLKLKRALSIGEKLREHLQNIPYRAKSGEKWLQKYYDLLSETYHFD